MSGPREHQTVTHGSVRWAIEAMTAIWNLGSKDIRLLTLHARLKNGRSIMESEKRMLREKIKASRETLDRLERRIGSGK